MAKPIRTLLKTLVLSAALLLMTTTSVFAGDEPAKAYPYTGAVSGDSVRMRTGPSTGHAISNVAVKADQLTVVAEKAGWLKVQMPSKAQCWISKKYVKIDGSTATVTANNVNLRIRPNTRNFPVGQASKSTLTAVMEGGKVVEKDGFIRVVPPATATLWISSKFVDFKAKIEKAEAKAEAKAVAPVKKLSEAEAKAKNALEEREVFKELELEIAKRFQLKGDKKLAEMRALMEQFSRSTEQEAIQKAAKAWVVKIDKVDKALAAAAAKKIKAQEAEVKGEKIIADAEAKRKKVLAEVRALLKKDEKEAGADTWVAEGFVADHNKKAVVPASHALVDANGKVIYYIRWDGGSLKGLWDKHVGVSGTVKNYKGWDKPVIIISNAKETPESKG